MYRFTTAVALVAAIAIFVAAAPAAAQVHYGYNHCPGHAVYAPVPAYYPPVHVYHPPVPVYHPQPVYVYRGGHHSYHYGHHYRPPVYHSNYHGMSPGAEIATGVIGILDGVLRSRHYYH